MFYISSKSNGKLGVTDYTDGVEEFFSFEELTSLEKALKKKLGRNIEIWGSNGANSYDDCFTVDIKKFLSLFYSKCDVYTKDHKKVSMHNYQKIIDDYLRQDVCFFEDFLKFLALKPSISSVIYNDFGGYKSIRITKDFVVLGTYEHKCYKLRDYDGDCAKPYVNEIAIELIDSNFNLNFHNLPYGESY